MKKDRLQRIFQHPVPCYRCLDGPGHFSSHLLNAAGGNFEVAQQHTLFGAISLKGRYMPIILIIIITLSGGETPLLAGYFPQVEEHILQTLEEELEVAVNSQFYLLIMVWNSMEMPEGTGGFGAILVGIQMALKLPCDHRSTTILAPLSREIHRRSDNMLAPGFGSFTDRQLINEQATITSQLLLTTLAARLIFGRHNSHRIACARAMGDVQPAVGWLPTHEG
jgi:hypothetical protein